MSEIAVLGLGQGGAVAAIKLLKAGHSVTVFEKGKKGEVSYLWYDDIRYDIFDYCGIRLPDRKHYTQKSKWLFVSPDQKNSLAVPPLKPMEEISVSRRGLSLHLASLIEEAGGKILYNSYVKRLVVNDDRVVGIECDGKEQLFDLAIDASGLNSPFRGQVPKKFGVQAKPGKNDIMRGYRAFYKRAEGSATPNPESTLYIKHLDGVGISWCNLNDRGEVDVLIGRIGGLSDAERDAAFNDLKQRNAILSNEVLIEGSCVDIGVRCPLGSMVANGYVAVGDSAFMTMPIMGSGIESSMKAGLWLAEWIDKNKIADFTASALWGYQTKFFAELGADYIFVDVFKRWALNVEPSKINWLFGCGAVTNDDMALLSTDSENPPKIGIGSILKKSFIILGKPSIVCPAIKWLLKALSAKKIASAIPKKYNAKCVAKWLARYNGVLIKLEKEA